MSTTKIKDVRTMFMGTVGNNNKNQSVGSESFSQIFDKTQGSKTNSDDYELKSSQLKKSDNIQDHMNIKKLQSEEKLQEKIQEMKKISEQEKMQQAAEEAGAAIVEKTAETFNVSVEEVETVLESMGLSPVDMLNCDNITKVVLALNPQLDALSVVTDEQLYADLKSLMNLAEQLTEDLKSQFNLSSDEANALFESMKFAETGEQIENLVTDDSDIELLSQKDGLGERVATDSDAIANGATESTTALENRSGNDSRNSTGHDENGNMAKQSFAQNIIDNMAEAVNKTQASQGTYGASGSEIIQQITDYIKLSVKSDTTELELQLHPASLGNVKVQIASTEGVLTATFTTQNEAVKAALEAQLIQLKESFEQQGLKVESIEVNVATQGFERSLDQQNEDRREYEGQAKKSRKIRLSGINDLNDISLDEIEEEDKVVVDMMLRNGNTVDYTV